ncbi:hypothetical protein [Agrobacterium larrymoorei]|uniref:hypothetical protein n=1 Tax=Agrobacterium larrymoorei TaxID=160699 RepID=UPI001F489F1A|nr:hypothetical protein [Agrobacterium larrymoorei]
MLVPDVPTETAPDTTCAPVGRFSAAISGVTVKAVEVRSAVAKRPRRTDRAVLDEDRIG